MEQETNLPETIEVNGVQYRRVDDYSNDPATQLLRRIEGVGKAAGWYDNRWATWAIMTRIAIDSGETLPLPPA